MGQLMYMNEPYSSTFENATSVKYSNTKSKLDTTNVQDAIDELNNIINVIKNKMSHVGSIVYSTTLNTMEKVIALYGGTKWERIEGRFLLGASNEYPIGTLGGEAEHTLSSEEMPTYIKIPYGGGTPASAGAIDRGTIYTNSTVEGYAVLPTQGGKAHNNMSPYKAVYIWERIE